MAPDAEVYRDKLRAMLPELAEKYGVSELGLFGSRVRGDHRPDSDLDVLVSFHPDAGRRCLPWWISKTRWRNGWGQKSTWS